MIYNLKVQGPYCIIDESEVLSEALLVFVGSSKMYENLNGHHRMQHIFSY